MDALSDVLRAVRLSGAFFFDVQASDPWVAETPRGESIVEAMFPGSEHLISYHLIVSGSAWVRVAGEPDMLLGAGDIVVLPHGDTHVLSSTPGLRRAPEMTMYRRPEDGQLPVTIAMGGSDNSPGTRFVCGFLGCDARPYNPLLSALPRIFCLNDHVSGALGAYFTFALAEASNSRLGRAGVLNRISELMFVDAVRRYLEGLPTERSNWLAGLRDPFVGRALAAMHRDPAREWTLPSLASEAALSRSALVERFTQFVGRPPMQYLADWRMQLAANHLRTTTDSVLAVAHRVGYQSEAAFSRAFKKAVGSPPGEWRAASRQSPGARSGA
ncbi:MAG TPA: AraC family transcriptional regulator [Steroidobacteraceae bacterium]|nr:AraC family transcriptional regulator [Steroidobacteraceae bacterium]